MNTCRQWADATVYVKGMLQKQLGVAIGDKGTPADFAEHMQPRNRELFVEAYAPVPSHFAVCHSEQHSPEDIVSIEQKVIGKGGDPNTATPIVTLVST